MKKKYTPIYTGKLSEVYEKESLVLLKLYPGFVLLKKIKGFWRLGTLSFRNKEGGKIVKTNVFNEKFIKKENSFIINENEIPITSFSFKEKVVYFSLFPKKGYIPKKYIIKKES